MARPRQNILYRQLPPGLVLTFLGTVDTSRPQGYVIVSATNAMPPTIQLVAVKRSRRQGREEVARAIGLAGHSAWLCWYNRRIGSWYYEFTVINAI